MHCAPLMPKPLVRKVAIGVKPFILRIFILLHRHNNKGANFWDRYKIVCLQGVPQSIVYLVETCLLHSRKILKLNTADYETSNIVLRAGYHVKYEANSDNFPLPSKTTPYEPFFFMCLQVTAAAWPWRPRLRSSTRNWIRIERSSRKEGRYFANLSPSPQSLVPEASRQSTSSLYLPLK